MCISLQLDNRLWEIHSHKISLQMAVDVKQRRSTWPMLMLAATHPYSEAYGRQSHLMLEAAL